MKHSKICVISICLLLTLSLVILIGYSCREYFAHFFGTYEIIDSPYLTKQGFWDYDGARVYYAEGMLHQRELWNSRGSWDIENYTPKKVDTRSGAASTATYILNNSIYFDQRDDLIVSAVMYDTQYKVWCVTFVPKDSKKETESYTVGTAFGVIFRKQNGAVLYIGPC